MSKKSLLIPAILLDPIPSYSSVEVADFMRTIYPAMIQLFEDKDTNYGGSWQKQGIIGVHANFNRKIDRIEAQFFNGTLGELTNENISDTFVDAANYNLMYLFFLYKKFEHIRKQVGDFQVKYLKDAK